MTPNTRAKTPMDRVDMDAFADNASKKSVFSWLTPDQANCLHVMRCQECRKLIPGTSRCRLIGETDEGASCLAWDGGA